MISLFLGGCRGLGDPPGFWGRGATEILSPLLEPWAFPSAVLPFVSSGPGARQVSEVPVPSVSPKLGLLELNGLGFPGMCRREAELCLGLGVRRDWSCLGCKARPAPSPLLGAAFGASPSAPGLGMLRIWKPFLLHGIFPAWVCFPLHFSPNLTPVAPALRWHPKVPLLFLLLPFFINLGVGRWL